MKKHLIDRKKIIIKIKELSSKNWWGDEFDVRFYLLSKIKSIKNKSILDIGGGIGIVSFDAGALKQNLEALMVDLSKAKPASAKGVYVKKVTISSTMGPGLLIDQASLEY